MATENRAQKMIAAQHRQKLQDASNAVNAVYTELIENTDHLTKLPEPIFKEHFLPFFTGQKSTTENPNVMQEWVSVAGSAMAKVDIINQDGETIFTVPPIYDSNIIKTAKDKLSQSFSDIYAQYNMHSNNLPMAGEKYLAEAFSEKIPTLLKPSETSSENQQGWEKIFQHYGLNEFNVQTPALLESAVDDIEYD